MGQSPDEPLNEESDPADTLRDSALESQAHSADELKGLVWGLFGSMRGVEVDLAPNDPWENTATLANIGIVAEVDLYVPEGGDEWDGMAAEFRGSERSEVIQKHRGGEVAFAGGIRIASTHAILESLDCQGHALLD